MTDYTPNTTIQDLIEAGRQRALAEKREVDAGEQEQRDQEARKQQVITEKVLAMLPEYLREYTTVLNFEHPVDALIEIPGMAPIRAEFELRGHQENIKGKGWQVVDWNLRWMFDAGYSVYNFHVLQYQIYHEYGRDNEAIEKTVWGGNDIRDAVYRASLLTNNRAEMQVEAERRNNLPPAVSEPEPVKLPDFREFATEALDNGDYQRGILAALIYLADVQQGA